MEHPPRFFTSHIAPVIVLVALIVSMSVRPLAAQDAPNRNIERARPSLDADYNEKRSEGPWLLGSPINRDIGIFLNSNTIVETGTPPQNESSIAISPIDPNFLIASAVDSRSGAYIYISYDGGKSWINKSLGIVHTGWLSGNDPSVGFDYLGNAYLMYGGFKGNPGASAESGVYIAKSVDKGETWTAHIVVIEHVGTMTKDSAFEDKYYIQIDNSSASPFRGRMYTPWKRVIDADSSTQIVVTHSTDAGLTWSEPLRVSPKKSGTSTDTTFGQSFPLLTTGPDGTLYAVWNDGPIRSIGFAKSTDGGLSFSDPTYPVSGYASLGTARTVGTTSKETYHVLKGTFRAETYPTLMADNSNSSRRGWLYLAWAAGTSPDVFFQRSTDFGATWSEAKVIHSDATNDQWWPWLSVDEITGDIAVMYSDSRDDPENILIHTWVSYSSNGGDSWIDRRATDAQSDFRNNPYTNKIFAGDYSGNAFRNGKIYPSFLDTRGDNDVYTAVMNINKPWPVDRLAVRSHYNKRSEARLTWENPPNETVFGLPVADYTLVLHRDGSPLAELPKGTTEYIDTLVRLDTMYSYSIWVAVGADTSVARSVMYDPRTLVAPNGPTIVEAHGFLPKVTLDVKIPATRGDSISPLENLKAYRVYRDGTLLRETPLALADTGREISIEDSPAERGYYRYWVTVIDGENPSNESRASDTVVVYAGDLSAYTEKFDGLSPRFLTSGTWGSTSAIALSAPNSWTDSPTGDYKARIDDRLQIFPVELTGPVELRFAQIVIVDPGDSSTVEVSFDSARSWQRIAQYTWNDDPAWGDKKADAGDWRQQVLQISPPPSGSKVAIVRFRLKTGSLNNADGWYLDDITFGFPSSVEEGTNSGPGGLSHVAYPNPAREAVIVDYRLSRGANVQVSLYDPLGRLRLRQDLGGQVAGRNAATLELKGLASGVYFYEIDCGAAGRGRGRIVVER